MTSITAPHTVLIVEDQEHTAQRFRTAVDACPELEVCGVVTHTVRTLLRRW